MTDERMSKYVKSSKKLSEIVDWIGNNKEYWTKMCFAHEENISLDDIQYLKEEFVELGYMELYMILITKIASALYINVQSTEFINFVKMILDKNLQLENYSFFDKEENQTN